MNITQIENNLQELVNSFSKDTFIYDLLFAYGQPKATISRLKEGGLNLSKVKGEIAWKKKLFFKEVQDEDVHEIIEDLKTDSKALKHDPRFIIVTDFETLLAVDRKTFDTLDVPILEIPKHLDFFLPWAGMEKAQHKTENPADVKAAEKMAKLYDEIKKDNPIIQTTEEVHNLNVFLSRLLFCFFAEDTSIFKHKQFTHAVSSHTQADGSDLNSYLDTLFLVMNTADGDRQNLPAYLEAFPYVNGGLFRNPHHAPLFTRHSRSVLVELGTLHWSEINPDIFGSMIQAVITPEHRGGMGMHYTSVPNIMKVIEPLFLSEFYEEFEAAQDNDKKLNILLERIQNIKIFDPACGSGNFLIIAYKELRKLEMKIFKELNSLALSNINLGNFYGIELDDFAHEVAILSLWLAEHQMNQAFFKEFGRTKAALPLRETGNIVQGNATRLDWKSVCPNDKGEIYILGNPPYLGARMQNEYHKEDISIVFKNSSDAKKIDYIACWFLKASEYISNVNSKYAFVTTNSICQGEQVSLLWPIFLKKNLEISFAHQSFKWENNAKANAGVTVVVIGVSNLSKYPKYIFKDSIKVRARNINSYLIDSDNIFIDRKSKPISKLPEMDYGNMAIDGGHLILLPSEREQLITSYPQSSILIKRIYGAQEFIKGVERYCLWINNEHLEIALNIPPIKKRIDSVKKFRAESTDKGTQVLASKSHQFREMKKGSTSSLIIPTVTSERRDYIPIGFVNNDIVIIAPNQVIYDSNSWIFSIITSRMHMTWIRAVAGRLKTDYRYSNSLCYNTFPFSEVNPSHKLELEKHVYHILEERENHSEKTLAQLYDPDKMPEDLREAHRQNDLAVERCYRSKPFESDEERLEYLFKLYEQMIEQEKTKGTLFENEKKSKKKK